MGHNEIKPTLILMSILLITIIGCSHFNDLYSFVEENFESSKKTITLNDFSKQKGFEWDTMYYLKPGVELSDFEKSLGIGELKFINLGYYIYFFKDNKLQYSEYNSAVEYYKTDNVIIYSTDTISKFTPDNNTFEIEKNGKTFFLKPI